jgi:hypothetical protein
MITLGGLDRQRVRHGLRQVALDLVAIARLSGDTVAHWPVAYRNYAWSGGSESGSTAPHFCQNAAKQASQMPSSSNGSIAIISRKAHRSFSGHWPQKMHSSSEIGSIAAASPLMLETIDARRLRDRH